MFRILALETSELSGSVAAAADGKVLAELQLDPQQRSAQSLAPAIHSLLGQVAWQPAEIQLLSGNHRARIVYRPPRGSGDGEGLGLCHRGGNLGNWHAGSHRRRRTGRGRGPIGGRRRPTRRRRRPAVSAESIWMAGSGSQCGAHASGRVALAAAAGVCRIRPGAQKVGRSATRKRVPRTRYATRSDVLASHGRQRGSAGLSRLSGRPPRRSLELVAPLLAAKCGGREVGATGEEGTVAGPDPEHLPSWHPRSGPGVQLFAFRSQTRKNQEIVAVERFERVPLRRLTTCPPAATLFLLLF